MASVVDWRWLGAACLAATLAACGGGGSSSSGGTTPAASGGATGAVVDGVVINGLVRAYSLSGVADNVWSTDTLSLVGEALTGEDGSYEMAFNQRVEGALLVEVTAGDDTRVKCAGNECGEEGAKVGFGETYVFAGLKLRSVVFVSDGSTPLTVPVTPLTHLVAEEVQFGNEAVTARNVFEKNSVVQKTFGLSSPPDKVLPVDITRADVEATADQVQHSIISAVAETNPQALRAKLEDPADQEGEFSTVLATVKSSLPADSAIKDSADGVSGDSGCDGRCQPDEFVEPAPEVPVDDASLVGSWKMISVNGDASTTPVIVNFLPNNRFVAGIVHPAGDACGDGVEYGEYYLDGNTLNLIALLDTLADEDCGMVGDQPGGSSKQVLMMSANKLSLSAEDDEIGEEILDFERIADNGVYGSWVVLHGASAGARFPGEAGSTVLSFLEDGSYMAAEFNNDGATDDAFDGVEYGRYTLSNGMISVTAISVDTNGTSGLSDIYEEQGSLAVAVDGLSLTIPGDGEFSAVRAEDY